VVTTSLGVLTLNMNDIPAAQHWYTASLDLARKQKDKRREYLGLSNLAEVEFLLGATDRAIELQRQAVAGLRQGNTIYIQGWGMVNLASYLIARGDLAEARSVATEALSVVRDLGGFVVRKCLEKWALLAAHEGRPREAAQLIGFVDAQLAASGEVREPAEQQVYERLQPLLDAALSKDEIEDRAVEGARWTEAEAVEFTQDTLIG
jgi:tetratricopeptide (TPR) repeat protein